MRYQTIRNEVKRLGGGPAETFFTLVLVEPGEDQDEALERHVEGFDERRRALWDHPDTPQAVCFVLLPDKKHQHPSPKARLHAAEDADP